MSLRLRLTLLYSTLMGAILLVISAAVTLVITSLLLNQIDDTLEAAQEVIINKIVVDEVGKVDSKLDSTDIGSDVYMQIWGLNGDLQSRFGVLKNFESTPFDSSALHLEKPVYRDLG